MATPTLSAYVDALPTVIDRDETNAALAELLDRADSGKDDPTEMAGALLEVLIHLSDSHSSLEAPLEARLFAWIKTHWRTEPLDAAGAMCSMMADMSSPEVAAFLDKKLEETKGSPAGEIVQTIITGRAEAAERRRKREEAAAAEKAADEARAANLEKQAAAVATAQAAEAADAAELAAAEAAGEQESAESETHTDEK